MQRFASRHPVWTLAIFLAAALLLWLIFAPWPPGLEQAIGRKRVFLNALFGGVTLGALYFLVASGFTLIFGLMRNVNLAHGSLYLLGGYLGFEIAQATESWLLAFPIVFVVVAILGVLMQHLVFRRMEGEELRQTLVTIGLSVVLAVTLGIPDSPMSWAPLPLISTKTVPVNVPCGVSRKSCLVRFCPSPSDNTLMLSGLPMPFGLSASDKLM